MARRLRVYFKMRVYFKIEKFYNVDMNIILKYIYNFKVLNRTNLR